jgi:hypothetical protein
MVIWNSDLPMPAAAPARPAHQAVRPALRSGEVRGRNGEILVRNNRYNEGGDQFDVPEQLREKGWSLQWVRESCHGKPDPQNVHNHMENGWRPVPSNRWPGVFHPKDHQGAIAREGMVLMERPDSLTQQAVEDGIRAARSQRSRQSAAFKGVDKLLDETAGSRAGFEASDETTDSRGVARPMIKRTLEQAPPSSYPSRTLAVGDEI